MLDQAESLRKLMNNNYVNDNNEKAKIITITSGKGGVGKSNFVVNLAISLQKSGKRVLIFDADIGMGNDDVLMGIFPKYNVMDLIKGRKALDEVLAEGPHGIKLLPGGSGLNNIEDLDQNERQTFLSRIEEIEGFDYILIDTGAGISRSVLAFIACSQQVILVTTPEPTSLTDGYSLLKAVKHFKIDVDVKVMVNKAFSKKESERTYDKFNSAVKRFLNLDIKYLGYILEDRKLVMAVREQTPFTVAYPNSDASKCIKIITNNIMDEENIKGIGAKGLFNKLFNIFS